MAKSPGNHLGMDRFCKCLKEAMKWYGVDKFGFDQKDLLPTAAVLAARIIDTKGRTCGEKRPRICLNGLAKDHNRKKAMKYLMRRAKFDAEECMVDLYCYSGQTDPFRSILTMECEGYPGHSKDLSVRASSETCDYLWDFFKLLQVPSPLRVFMAICTEEKRALLEKKVEDMVSNYEDIVTRDEGEVFAVIFPETKLTGVTVRVQGWAYPSWKKRTSLMAAD